jgi:hypothetical protein
VVKITGVNDCVVFHTGIYHIAGRDRAEIFTGDPPQAYELDQETPSPVSPPIPVLAKSLYKQEWY